MKARIVCAAAVWVCTALTVGAAEPSYRVAPGDTLWDLSGRQWNDPSLWPELWAMNPHIRNPHWIFPGEEIRFDRSAGRPARPEPRIVRLPVERLTPAQGAGTMAEAAGAPAPQRGTPAAGAEGAARPVYRFARARTQDFISSHPLPRLGTVDTRSQRKVVYAPGEEIEIAWASGRAPAPGTRLTAFDDRQEVLHPSNGEPMGRYVRILAHLEVVSSGGGRAVARIVEGYDAVENGAGVMAYRPPAVEVAAVPTTRGLEGVVLRGEPDRSVYGEQDLIFLDRGRIHGVERGLVVEFPASEARRSAQGMVDLRSPLARAVVIGVEDKTSSAVVVESRVGLEPGDRFLAAGVSP
ncbi:LysM peptidoglycan-binding domain-containing protein [Deferrisoma camini]|uniref:LysM peptidoglycan-binding domain-containing protein n=1 Tax=Deferrisoma camini TaxID=1035120 RepID=UPI00046CEB2D|nr:LysM domain-containing protein [Deferrisoma camini]